MVYDNSDNDYFSCPHSYISRHTSVIITVPAFGSMDESIGKMLGSIAKTDLSKIGMSYASIITSPKPMSVQPRNTPARGLGTKKSLANSRDTTGKQL